jgi:hypothetical protein
MLPLSTGNLAALAPDVAVPSYDRSQVRVGIVHLGEAGSIARTRPCTWTV